MTGAPRYAASDRTEHGCCWGASVVDTELDPRWPTMVVECEDIEMAERIADMLNGDLPVET